MGLVVMDLPERNFPSSNVKGKKCVLVEELVADAGIEAFDVGLAGAMKCS